jgi:hypothetical protein
VNLNYVDEPRCLHNSVRYVIGHRVHSSNQLITFIRSCDRVNRPFRRKEVARPNEHYHESHSPTTNVLNKNNARVEQQDAETYCNNTLMNSVQMQPIVFWEVGGEVTVFVESTILLVTYCLKNISCKRNSAFEIF